MVVNITYRQFTDGLVDGAVTFVLRLTATITILVGLRLRRQRIRGCQYPRISDVIGMCADVIGW